MPRKNFDLEPGAPLPSNLREILEAQFSSDQLRRLERLGGRVSVVLTAPYVDRRKGRQQIVVDDSFVEDLRHSRADDALLIAKLKPLSTKQLRSLCGLLGQPVRSSMTKGELKKEINKTLRADDVWKQISNS